jgi:hypothetical protein
VPGGDRTGDGLHECHHGDAGQREGLRAHEPARA